MSISLLVEMQFAPGVWTDVSDDLNGADPIRLYRGIKGSGPKDIVASTGTFDFVLKNHAGNSGGLQGYYSPNNPNCRSGFGYTTPVRASFVWDGTPFVRWTGRLRTIYPVPGLAGSQRTICQAQDCMGWIGGAVVKSVARQRNQTEDVVLNAALDALPASSQPTARSFDAGLYTLPVALDDLSGGAKGLNVCERIVTSVQGKLFPDGAGTLVFQNNETVALQISQYTFDDTEIDEISVPTSLDSVFNDFALITHPKSDSPSTMVLASHSGTPLIKAGRTETIWLTYTDPDRPEVKIGGDSFITVASDGHTLTPTTDFLANSQADGGGSNLTASVSVYADFFGSTVKLQVTNSGGTDAYMTLLQVRGTGIYDLSPVTRRAYTEEDYDDQPIEIDLAYMDDEEVSQQFADYLQASYRNLSRQVVMVGFNPHKSDALMEQALEREVGEVIDLSETVALPTAVSCFIQNIEITVKERTNMYCRFGLAPRIVLDMVQDDEVPVLDSLFMVVGAPETRVDYAAVGFSEVA